MSDRLVDMYLGMIRTSLQHNVYSDNSTYIAVANKYKNPLVKQRPATVNDYTDSAPYGNNANTNDRLVQADVFKKNGELIFRRYTETHPYDKTPNERTLRFTQQQAPSELIPQQGQVYGTDFYGGNQYNDQRMFAPIAEHVPGAIASTDVFAIANWIRNIGQEFGFTARPGATKGEQMQNIAKGATFLATQVLLTAFNPGDPQYGGVLNQIYNPAHIPLSAIPFLRGSTTLNSPTLAAAASVNGDVYSQTQNKLPANLDRHLLMRAGTYAKALCGTDVAQLNLRSHPGFVGDLAASGKTQTLADNAGGISIQAQVDQSGLLANLASNSNLHLNTYTSDKPYKSDGSTAVIDIENLEQSMLQAPNVSAESIYLPAMFKDATSFGSAMAAAFSPLVPPSQTKYTWLANKNPQKVSTNPASTPSDFDVAFPGERSDGTIAASKAVPDDQLYMPFTFQDLRDKYPSLLYFRAYLHDGLQETFAPNWKSENYYGRVDPVPTYQNTERSFSLEFDVVAWSPKDLKVMWIKLQKLQSMVYPSFDTDKFLQTGPLVRMRVGDLICASPEAGIKKGLPGYINALSFAYDDGIWNVSKDYKIPRKVTVSLGYTVIHDGNPGIYQQTGTDGSIFGSYELRDGVATLSQGDLRGIMQTIAPDADQNAGSADYAALVKGMA